MVSMRERLDLIREGKREYLMSVAETNYESRAAISSCTVPAWINKSHPTTTNQTHHSVSNHSQKKLERQEKSLTQQKWELLTNPNRLGLQKKPKQVKDKRGCLGTEAGGWLGDVSLFQEVKSVGRSRESPTCLSYLFLCYWHSGHGNS